MAEYTGGNVKNISLKKQSDVIIKKILSAVGTINFPADTESLKSGQVLITTDGGETWDVAANDAEPNGILCENITKEQEAEVLLIGVVREKYLEGLDATHKTHLFNNKIILR